MITPSRVVSEAWQLVHGLKLPILICGILTSVIAVPFILLNLLILHIDNTTPAQTVSLSNSVLKFFIQFLTAIAGTSIWTVALMMGIRKALGLSIQFTPIKKACLAVLPQLFMGIVMYAFLQIIFTSVFLLNAKNGLILAATLVLNFIFVALITPLFNFIFPLIIMRKWSVSQAIASVFQKGKQYWQLIFSSFAVIAIFSLCFQLITLGMRASDPKGLIMRFFILLALSVMSLWLIPLNFTLTGVLFREI